MPSRIKPVRGPHESGIDRAFNSVITRTQASQKSREFVASVSHELKTPLLVQDCAPGWYGEFNEARQKAAQ
jgi:hypothetical protein